MTPKKHPVIPLIFLLLGGLCAPAAAQPSSIECRIGDVWREPVGDAAIYNGNELIPGQEPLARSAASGRCVIEARPGQRIIVDHPDFAPRVLQLGEADLARGHIAIVLYEGGAVHGFVRVVNEPVATDYIFMRYTNAEIYGGVMSARSGKRGRFHLTHVPQGTALITAGIRDTTVTRSVTHLIDIREGGRDFIHVSLMDTGAQLRAAVIGPAGKPAAAQLSGSVRVKQEVEDFEAATAVNGEFHFPALPWGQATLRAQLPDGAVKRVDFQLKRNQTSTVTVDFTTGTPIACRAASPPPDTRIDFLALDGQVAREQLQPLPSAFFLIRAARAAQLDTTPTANLPGLPPGQYTLVAIANGETSFTLSQPQLVHLQNEPLDVELIFDDN